MIKNISGCIFSVFFLGMSFIFINCGSDWQPADCPIPTKWSKDVSPDNVHPEYPRPMLVREKWMNLNGLWEYAVLPAGEVQSDVYDGKILVPFPIESSLSGVRRRITEEERLWYYRTFEVPSDWNGSRIILNFEAVDWETSVWVNGEEIGSHKGGYDPFSFDITDELNGSGLQEIVVSVWDPADKGEQPRGKQVSNPRGIYYTPSTGIWQTVWLEPVNEKAVKDIRIIPDVDSETVSVSVIGDNITGSENFSVKVSYNGSIVTETSGPPGTPVNINIPDAELWSPDSPSLYDLDIEVISGDEIIDKFTSYFGMRKISLGKDDKGFTRLMLNNEFVFQLGPLDQGFWSDGLHTPPAEEAYLYDLEFLKEAGFNMLRKHVKVESRRFYYLCDKLGLMIWQDMPNANNGRRLEDDDLIAEARTQFESELNNMVESHINHPCIIVWVPFNEGWGQYDSGRITDMIKEWDPTRLVNHASGWTDRGVSDIKDIHAYPGPDAPEPEEERATVLGEFGGLGLNVEGHSWQEEGWGYALMETQDDLLIRYENLFVRLLPMINDNGLSAAVYTQVSDIETENNGLMTYDREVQKINASKLRLIHEGFLPPGLVNNTGIFIDEIDVEMECMKPGYTIRYTLDGTEPAQNSPAYNAPVRLTDDAGIKAKAFWEDGKTSRTVSFDFEKVIPEKALHVQDATAGITVSYYEGSWDVLPDFSTMEPVETNTVSRIDLIDSGRQEDFGLVFEGFIEIPETGVYIFYTNTDDGSRIFIAGRKVVDDDGLHGTREVGGAIALEKGMHPFKVEYFQKKGGLGLQVLYEGPGIDKREIPGDALFNSGR